MTTPAAIPATFGPPSGFFASSVVVITVACACVCPGAVTTIVLARVTMEGSEFFIAVGDGLGDGDGSVSSLLSDFELSESEFFDLFSADLELSEFELDEDLEFDPDALPTLLLRPVSWIDQLSDPPPGF